MSLRKCNFLYVELLRIDLNLQMRFNSAKPYKTVTFNPTCSKLRKNFEKISDLMIFFDDMSICQLKT